MEYILTFPNRKRKQHTIIVCCFFDKKIDKNFTNLYAKA